MPDQIQPALKRRAAAKRAEPAKPGACQVLLHNDDFTPREFVVAVLEFVFHKAAPEAVEIMMRAHRHGLAVVGAYSHEVAETKVARAHELAAEHEYPLMMSLRED